MLTSLQLLAIPADAGYPRYGGIPAIANFPAVAVVSTTLVFLLLLALLRKPYQDFLSYLKTRRIFCERFCSIVFVAQIYQRTKTTLYIVAKFRRTVRSEGQNHNPSIS